jgi:hypothetical protein
MSEHPRGRLVGWFLLALAGLAVAVALSVTASNLSTQPIGLSGEPLRAGDRLAPASVTRTTTAATAKKAKSRKPPVTHTTPTPTTTLPVPSTGSSGDSDDHGGERHHDSDDD